MSQRPEFAREPTLADTLDGLACSDSDRRNDKCVGMVSSAEEDSETKPGLIGREGDPERIRFRVG